MNFRKMEKVAKSSHIRNFVLLTFIHSERQGRSDVTRERIKDRLLKIFHQTKILIISTERHRDGGFHYHAGLFTTVSRHRAKKMLRSAFPEWEGMSIDLQFRRGWPVICAYVTKEDCNFLVWGASRAEILEQARLHKNHRRRKTPPRNKKTPPNKQNQKSKPEAYRLDFKRKAFLHYLIKSLFGAFVLSLYFYVCRECPKELIEFLSPLIELIEKIVEYFFPSPPPLPLPPEPTTLEKMKDLASTVGWRIFEALKAVFFAGDRNTKK